MKSILLPILLLFGLFLAACREKASDGLETKEITITDTVVEEDPGPPEPPYLGKAHEFSNPQDWLFYLCDSTKPTDEVVAYYFHLLEYPGEYSVLFTGNKRYDPADKKWIHYIDERVQDSYVLPAADYKGLGRPEVLKKFSAVLKRFTETPRFKQSFFAKAKGIGVGFFEEDVTLIK
jgi:hypothetical protein